MDNQPQNKYMPDSVSPPGDTLFEILDNKGISQAEFADRTGRSKKTISEIISGKARITPETSLQFERVLGIPSSFWNNRQKFYDEYMARKAEEEALEEQAGWAKNFKYEQMARLGWVETTREKTQRISNLLDFFGVASAKAWKRHWDNIQVAYRISRAYKCDDFALAAWLRQGEIMGRKIECSPYNEDNFLRTLSQIRKLTTQTAAYYQLRVIELCAKSGVAVAFVPELPKTASGATRWLASDKALLQLSLKYKTDDHLWFTFFHEAGHIIFHKKKPIFIETGEEDNEEEEKANRFSSEFLLPKKKFEKFISIGIFRKRDIIDFAAELHIAPGIVVGQLQHRRLLPYNRFNDLKVRLEWKKK